MLHKKTGCKEKVREIYYAWGKGKSSKLEQMLKFSKRTDCVAIQLEELIAAYGRGIDLFLTDLEADSEKAAYAMKQASKMLSNLSEEKAQDLSNWA